MKITKYLVVTLLVVCVGKKVLSAAELGRSNRNLVSGGWVTDREKYNPSMISTFDGPGQLKMENPSANNKEQFTVNLSGSAPIMGTYNPRTGTAKIKFENVIKTSQSITPPNVSNPNYVMIGYMKNPKKYPGTQNRPGGQSANITLWGIPANSNDTTDYALKQMPDSTVSTKLKKYNRSNKTATMKDGSTYVGVIEYSQSVTPPNIMIPAMKPFATIRNTNQSNQQLLGGQLKNSTLWGLEVAGNKVTIKSTKKENKNETVGKFWPESNIAQLDNGQTIVGVMQELKGNYTENGAHAKGPVWTRYSEAQLDAIKLAYNIIPSSTNVTKIGMVKMGGQKYVLYGIVLEAGSNTAPSAVALKTQPLNLTTVNQNPLLDNEDELTALPSSQMTSSQAVRGLYNI